MDEKLKNELRKLENPLAALKAQIDQVRQEIKLRPLKEDDTEAEDALIRSFGILKTGVKLAGYPIDKVTVPSSTNPGLSVQAAYNSWAVLDYANKKAIEGGTSYADLLLDKAEIKTALMKATSFLLIPDSDIVVDEATAKLAKAYSEFFQKITRQSEGIYSRLSDDFQKTIKDKIKKKLEKKSPKGTKINKERVEEETIKIMDLIPKNMKMLETLFEMAECRYRMQQFSKEIEALNESPVLLGKQIALRQKLLNFLPENLRGDMPKDLNEAFFVQYQTKCSEYLEIINSTERLNNLDKLSGTNISTKFDKEKNKFKEELPTFLNQTLTKLKDKIAPTQQSTVEIEVPLSPVKEGITSSPEVPVEPVIEEKSVEDVIAGLEEGESLPEPESEKLEEKTAEIMPPSPAPIEEPVKELSWDVKELQNMIEESNKTLKEQENKIKEQEEKIKTLGNTFNVLSHELSSFEVELQGQLTKKEKLREESARLKKWLEQEGPSAQAQLQKQQAELATQRKSIVKLKEEVAGDRLALDWRTHKDELAWLGLKSEEDLKDYLDAQEQETAIFGEARATASNWWKSAWGEKVRPPIDYKVANTELLKNLDNTDNGLIGAQEEFEKQVKLLDQQVIKNQDQLETLNIQLPILEKEMETLEQQIKEKKATKIQIENDKKRAEGEKEKLETDNKELLIWKERLDEQKKLVDAEEEKKKLKADQLEKTNPLEQKAEQFVKDKESLEKMVAPVPNEAVNTTTTEEFSGTEKAKTPKERYNELKEKYEEAKRLNKNIISALLARIKGWFVYQKAKLSQPNFPPSPAVFPLPPKASAENAEMPENQKDKKPGSSTSSIKEGF